MDATLTLDEGDVPAEELPQRLEAVATQALPTQLNSAADDIAVRLRGRAAENAPVDTGQLRSSLEGAVEQIGETVFRIVVGSNLDQAGPMEFGTEAGHFPPVDELRDWARRVLGDESAAYPVARSIAETGLEARRYLRDSFEDLEFALNRVVEAVVDAFAAEGLA